MVLCDKINKLHWAKLHPAVMFLYFIMVIVLTMCVTSPILLACSFMSASLLELVVGGIKRYVRRLRGMLLLTVVIALGNMMLSHNGMHVLFYVNGNAITGEAFWYGLFFGGMLATAYVWFDLFQMFCDSEKLIFIFGKTMPTLGLLISMTLHYIPLLGRQLSVVRDAQRGMGRDEHTSWLAEIKQRGKEFSILISWSLENAIDTSDAMTARGYGLGRRSHFHTYRFRGRDAFYLALMSVMFVLGALGTFGYAYRVYYYPSIVFPGVNNRLLLYYGSYVIFVCLPLFWEGIGVFYERIKNK
ncbi:MAG: energy-coupling factor transporter transmembrane component T [Lachnospiraceae bacterium]|nr:energy-coupling factor transporter transmembrane component T [Lachnospiraceae bacterium]